MRLLGSAGANCGLNCSKPQLQLNGQYSAGMYSSRALTVLEAHDAAEPLFLYMPFREKTSVSR